MHARMHARTLTRASAGEPPKVAQLVPSSVRQAQLGTLTANHAKLITLISHFGSSASSMLESESWLRSTSLLVLIYEGIQLGIFTFDFAPQSRQVNHSDRARRLYMNISQEGCGAIEDLLEWGLVRSLKMISKHHDLVCAYQITDAGRDYAQKVEREHLLEVSRIAFGPKPYDKVSGVGVRVKGLVWTHAAHADLWIHAAHADLWTHAAHADLWTHAAHADLWTHAAHADLFCLVHQEPRRERRKRERGCRVYLCITHAHAHTNTNTNTNTNTHTNTHTNTNTNTNTNTHKHTFPLSPCLLLSRLRARVCARTHRTHTAPGNLAGTSRRRIQRLRVRDHDPVGLLESLRYHRG